MFSKRDKVKELAIYLISGASMQYTVSKNPYYQPHGVAYAKKFSFSSDGINVSFNKWVVDNYADASRMKLDGYQYNGRLIGGVNIVSKMYGTSTFYGNDARDIINACEYAQTTKLPEIDICNHR